MNTRPPSVGPTVGRVVHFYDREEFVEATRREIPPPVFAAIVRRVRGDDGTCDLVVFTDYGPRNVDAVRFAESDGPEPGAWCWPARV